ncbi:unnamed protein product, partial [Nesidiocoris tenuis]
MFTVPSPIPRKESFPTEGILLPYSTVPDTFLPSSSIKFPGALQQTVPFSPYCHHHQP